MGNLISNALVRGARQLAAPLAFTYPSILDTFRCRPEYHESFKRTWLALLWGGEAEYRRMRESIAVAISVANQCFY